MQDISSATPRLSQLFVDPVLRAAFERAERDQGQAGACLPPPRPHLPQGSAERVRALATKEMADA